MMNAVRSLGYLFQHMMRTAMKIPPTLLSPFCRVSDALFSDNFFWLHVVLDFRRS